MPAIMQAPGSNQRLWNLALVEHETVPSNYPSIVPRTYYLIPEIPMGQPAGLRWMTESLKESIEAEENWQVQFWGEMCEPGAKSTRRLLVEALKVREEVRNRILRWNGDESSSFDVDAMENLTWPRTQAARCHNTNYPLPEFSGEEVQMRRVCITRLLKDSIKDLGNAEDELIELAMSRKETVNNGYTGFEEESSRLLQLCREANNLSVMFLLL
ncbi:hypothetical protein K435DRAFT_856343 [Dendrothele bispora CBS 962.96]|uniref:Uncharacterized protein n=1 Tax=Dendrothele bispora (strain CBS 962.96) TaxID=1314807 RepID=A0A4S8M909_DENBC|nr:hypothetical protein K435DRAFT_856343 [Dendrothele bispora CBS 962.96]